MMDLRQTADEKVRFDSWILSLRRFNSTTLGYSDEQEPALAAMAGSQI